MSARKRVVETYIEGFRQGDHRMILGCLTDDVVWVLHGYRELRGKEAFEREIGNPAFEGRPSLTIEGLVEEGDCVVAFGRGRAAFTGGRILDFVFADAFIFDGPSICRLETYQVNVGGDGEGEG